MNSGDVPGDASFMLRAAGLPWLCSNTSGQRDNTYDCQDIEQSANDLVVTKVIVEADSRFSGYAECNVNSSTGAYDCQCRAPDPPNAPHGHHQHRYIPCNRTVGKIAIVNESGWAHEAPDPSDPSPWESSDYRYWFYNAAQKFSNGVWYSTLAEGECDERASGSSNSSANDAPCFWRLASTIKRVSKTCHDSKVFEAVEAVGKERFDVCKQPLDRKGECWTLAFYDTFLGPKSNSTSYAAGSPTGMPQSDLEAAWAKAFVAEEDGGCPAL